MIDEKNPMRSAVVLALDDDPREDGLLQMREIYDLKLRSELVVLSACQSGLGQHVKGEGIQGINRSFFHAGTSAVLMSLWPVNDQVTSQFMERFYFHLLSAEPIMGALRTTKLEMISSDSVDHPYYWAGFIVSGKADQIIFPEKSKAWMMVCASVLLIGVVFSAARKKKKSASSQP
jgi:CHAT domain-containing protein